VTSPKDCPFCRNVAVMIAPGIFQCSCGAVHRLCNRGKEFHDVWIGPEGEIIKDGHDWDYWDKAPMDGTRILALMANGACYVTRWDGKQWICGVDAEGEPVVLTEQFIHWHDLPAIPESLVPLPPMKAKKKIKSDRLFFRKYFKSDQESDSQ